LVGGNDALYLESRLGLKLVEMVVLPGLARPAAAGT